MNIRVIALTAAFNSSRELLLLKRPDDIHCGGLWSFPGGRVEEGETHLNAAIRELKEETGLSATRWRHLGKGSHTYSDRTLNFLFFVCHCPYISGLNSESTHTWSRVDELEKFPMPEANARLLPMLSIPEIDEYLSLL